MIQPRFEWLLPPPLALPPVLAGFGAPVATLLARRGFARSPAATAREFAAALAGRPELHGPVRELTSLYERVRFGGDPLTSAEEARIAGLLRDLATAPRSPS